MTKNYTDKMMMLAVRLLVLCLPALLLLPVACTIDDGDHFVKSELGSPENVYTVSAEAGELGIQVLTDQQCQLTLLDPTQQWLTLKQSAIKGDDNIQVSFSGNNSFPRQTRIRIYAPDVNRADTITVRQQGITPYIRFETTNRVVRGSGETFIVDIDTNIPNDQIETNTDYTDDYVTSPWISRTSADDVSRLQLTADANPADNKLRHARITFSFTDEWGETTTQVLYLVQQTSLNKLGAEISFADLRQQYVNQKIDGDYILTGYVVSDGGNQNVDDTPNTTKTTINYAANNTTAYIESLDGHYGFRIKTATAEDNVFRRNTKIDLLIKGVMVERQTNPDCYTLTGVTSAMIASTEDVSAAQIPSKRKYLSELTDDDLFTLVTLKQCEFPVRKGSFTPVNEGYTDAFGVNRVAKYPLLFRDIQGNSAYCLFNMKCPWRRSGETLPYGQGTITGILVHETYTRFHYKDTNDEETYGQIGRYQIRPMDRSDISISNDFESGFSKLLTEYRYYNPSADKKTIYPTTGTNGEITVTNGTTIVNYLDWSYLGPIGASNKGNIHGNGVIKADGTQASTSTSTNSDGKGVCQTADSPAWRFSHGGIWSDDKNRGEGWCIKFSTAGVTKALSMQLAVMNQSYTGPVYWAVEYALNNPQNNSSWTTVTSFSIPPAIQWSNSCFWQTAGYMYVDIPLPQALANHQEVYVRIVPTKNKAGSTTTYDDQPIGSGYCAMSYVGVRYNK